MDAASQVSYVDVPGGRVHVRRWIPPGRAHDVPLVLLHESLGSTDQWRQFPALLAESLSRTVISYDRLGFGKSSARTALPSLNFIQEEADLRFPHLKAALGLDRYILFGHSVGGPMAIAIAAGDGDCAAVITESAQAFVEERTIIGVDEARRAFMQPGQLDRLRKWHGEKARWVLRAWTDIWLAPEYASWSLQPYAGRVTCPVLALHGDGDEYGSVAFPEFVCRVAGNRSRMIVLKDCGHVPHREQPQEVLKNVQAFLDGLELDGTSQ